MVDSNPLKLYEQHIENSTHKSNLVAEPEIPLATGNGHAMARHTLAGQGMPYDALKCGVDTVLSMLSRVIYVDGIHI